MDGRFGSLFFDSCCLELVDLSGCDLGDSSILKNTYRSVQFPEALDNHFVARIVLKDLLPVVRSSRGSEGLHWFEFLCQTDDVQPVSEAFYEGFSQSEAELLKGLLFPKRIRSPYDAEGKA
jgi:hypothetical protein